MKRTVFGMATLLLLGATPCVVNAFTAIAWSESGQRGGSVKQAPTKEAAISAAIADCKKNGGGSDCQVFKVTDEPGFVALYASCAKTCGVTAVTGRATAEQARADGKRDCEAHYRNTCQLAQEWEEGLGTQTVNSALAKTPPKDDKYNCHDLESKLQNTSVEQLKIGVKQYSDVDLVCAKAYTKANNLDPLLMVILWEFRLPERGAAAVMAVNNDCPCKWQQNNKARELSAIEKKDLFQKLTKLAEGNDGKAQFDLADLYLNGVGVIANIKAAYQWFKKSADNGYEGGQLMIGSAYQDGLVAAGIPIDEKKAIYWHTKSASQGNILSQVALGDIYSDSQSTSKDYAAAANWYSKASEKGEANAQYGLGYLYAKGLGVQKDENKAIYWFQKAAEQEHSISQHSLGVIYARRNDTSKSLYWLSLAASNGNKRSIELLKKVGLR